LLILQRLLFYSNPWGFGALDAHTGRGLWYRKAHGEVRLGGLMLGARTGQLYFSGSANNGWQCVLFAYSESGILYFIISIPRVILILF
jgi:outer membrane protein assembly factor BamB